MPVVMQRLSECKTWEEVCSGYVTGYVARSFHNSTFPGQEALALGTIGFILQCFGTNVLRGGCRKRRLLIHTLCNGVCSGCRRRPRYIPPHFGAHPYTYIYIHTIQICIYLSVIAFVYTHIRLHTFLSFV